MSENDQELIKLLGLVRDHYAEQLVAFIRRQSASKRGAGEVKLKLQSGTCVDFLENDKDGVVAVDLGADRKLTFDPLALSYNGVRLHIGGLCWDDVHIDFDASCPNIGAWFDAWFDPEEKNFDATAELSGRVHSVICDEGHLWADFGSAPPAAFLDLVDVFANAGVGDLRIRTEV